MRVFRRFQHKEEVVEIYQLLKRNNIPSTIKENGQVLDQTFGANQLNNNFELKIPLESFNLAETVIEKYYQTFLDDLEPDYPVLNFSNQELYQIISTKDQWSDLDYLLAKKLLKQRGEPLDNKTLEDYNTQRITHLSKKEKSQNLWLIVGVIAALTTPLTFYGGFIGSIIGYGIWKLKKNLPNGTNVFYYNNNDRTKGKWLLMLSTITLLVYVIYNIYSFYFLSKNFE